MSGKVAKRLRREALAAGIDPASAKFRRHYQLLKLRYNQPGRAEGGHN